jgi:hypothetical protein
MFSFLNNLCNHILKIIFAILVLIATGCSDPNTPSIDVSPKHFKIQTPFILNSRGIIINTYWGSEKKHHVLCLDTHSPSWIKSSVVNYDHSFTKSRKLGFKTSAADGSPIQGDVGICDSFSFENIVFKKVPFYVMPENVKDDKEDDGVFGIDALSKGVWKIDFVKEELTFASGIDSFPEISQTEMFPANFKKQVFTVDVHFGNKQVKAMAVDLGYNGNMLLPASDFDDISSSKKIYKNISKFNTPVSENIVNNLSVFDTIKIHHNWFLTMVSTNDKVTERLIGLDFFKKFNYVIFDFINQQIFIPKKIW